MNKELKFNKENNSWYIDIPEWKGTKGELLMVAGADRLLDVLDTDNNNTVQVSVNTNSSKDSNITLSKIINCCGGASYMAKSNSFNRPIWLCAVTKYVFGGELPKKIYVTT
jgi:hypothetical protein